MIEVMRNCTTELTFNSGKRYKQPFNDVSLKMIVTGPDKKEKVIPGFWDGEDVWKLRFSSKCMGRHKFRTECSDLSNDFLHGHEGEFEVIEYSGNNHLYMDGPVKTDSNGRYLKHDSGKPFFWLADTWWMGLTNRLKWPGDFKLLTEDRVKKGFNVIQIVAGLYPDMEWGDIRGTNEAGLPWDKGFKSINPEYFKHADKKIEYLCDNGLMPCIVGCWGYFAKFAGKDTIKKHWEYLVARWGSYPVAWCMAGEALMPFYNDADSLGNIEEYKKEAKRTWTEITRHVKAIDPYQRLLTIHPGCHDYSRNLVEDTGLIDLDMMQTGHSGYASFGITVKMAREGFAMKPSIPLLNSEVCYEGISASNFEDVQRFMFWSCVLSGTCGHTYGANGIWQMNSVNKPYGPSPHGLSWGDTPWEEAYKLPGSRQLGLGKKLMEKYEWWRFEQHQEWVKSDGLTDGNLGYFAAGIPGKVRVIFIHINGFHTIWQGVTIKGIEKGVTYNAYWFDPVTGGRQDLGYVSADVDGCWNAGKPGKLQDFVLVLEWVG